MPAPKSILFIVVSRIGDTLFATPAIRAVARAYPHAKITVLAHPKRGEILKNLPFVSHVGPITKKMAPWKGWFSRSKPFDLAFVYNFDEPLVTYALRVSRSVVAFSQKDQNVNRQLHHAVPPPPFQSEHAVKQLLRLPAVMGMTTDDLRLAYHCSDTEKKWAAEKLKKNQTDQSRPLIGLQVASFPTKGYRDWPVESFLALCRHILDEWPKAHFLLFGGSNEKTRTHWLKSELGDKATLYAGQLSLRETAAMMSWLDLYIGIDTGPTHIMSTFDIPMIAMYHCLSSSEHTGPLGHPMAYIIDHPRTSTASCNESTPMAEISVEQVMHQVRQALADHPPVSR